MSFEVEEPDILVRPAVGGLLEPAPISDIGKSSSVVIQQRAPASGS